MQRQQYNIAVLPGDGIGPEVINEAIKVLKAISQNTAIEISFTDYDMGASSIEKTGEAITDETINACANSDAILFGAIGDPKYDNDPNVKVRPEEGLLKLRKNLGLYANIRPVTAYEQTIDLSPLKRDRIEGVDFVICRELTSGIYFGDKGYSDDSKTEAYDHCVYNEEEIKRILQKAFNLAHKRRKKLTLVDKANVMETSRLWRRIAQQMSNQFTEVELDFLFVDNAAMQIITHPKQFDVIVTSNMFGDILSDEASVISGSLGMLPSASVGSKTALFEPIHGSYPQAKGQNIANPVACILSAAMMLDHLGHSSFANTIRDAVEESLNNGVVSKDLDENSFSGTSEIGDYIAEKG